MGGSGRDSRLASASPVVGARSGGRCGCATGAEPFAAAPRLQQALVLEAMGRLPAAEAAGRSSPSGVAVAPPLWKPMGWAEQSLA
jgi:hypothetical protein